MASVLNVADFVLEQEDLNIKAKEHLQKITPYTILPAHSNADLHTKFTTHFISTT